MYIAPGRGRQPIWDKNFMTTERPICLYVASFKMISSKSDLIHIFNDFIHVYSPGARTETPLGKLSMSTESPYHFIHLLQVSNKSLWILILYTVIHVMFFHLYITPGQGQTTLCGQNSDVNSKAFSFCPFIASFKKVSLKSDFIHNFSCFYTFL